MSSIQNQNQQKLFSNGYQKAIELLESCITEHGFLATPTELNNYRRIWARDSCIMGLAALLTEQTDLVEGCRHTLETLMRYQGPHGEIPSNVDPVTKRVSYGGTAGRVDGNLWFVICCGQYWRLTKDQAFLNSIIEPLERVRFLLGAWEFNTRGLLYVPLTGDWADEYVHNGYVLYDQLLYLQAQRELCEIHGYLHDGANHQMDERIFRLKHLIRSNYWFEDDDETIPDDVYHEILYKNGRSAAKRCAGKYWAPFFSPTGYGYRFDALANALASLLGVADSQQQDAVDAYIEQEIGPKELPLLPAFHPVITPRDEDWEELHVTFSYTFKNKPYEYHNGGLWPFVTGFYVADLVARDKKNEARHFLEGIHQANSMEMEEQHWSFPEYLHGQEFEPGGTSRMGWSAAGAIVGQKALEGKILFGE